MKPNFYLTLLTVLLVTILFSCKSDDNSINDPDPSGILGELVWAKTFGGSDVEEAISVVLSNDGGYVILGSTNSKDGDIVDRNTTDNFDYWVLKLNANGDKVWSKTYGGTNDDNATSINKTSDGGYIISGFSQSNDGDVVGNEGSHDYWILKINGIGGVQWNKNFGFSGSDKAFKVIETKEGGYFATGFLDVNASGGLGNDDGRSPEHSLGDYWGIKMDSNGNKIWRRFFGGSHVDISNDVIQTPDEGFLLIGVSESTDFDITNPKGGNDFWVVKVSPQGDKVWENSFGGSEIEIGYALTKTTDGNYIVVGDTRSSDKDVSTPLGNADVWAVKFNSTNGNLIWEKTYGGNQFESARGITQLENGNYLISGNTRSANGNISNNNGLNDAWVFIIDENGNLEFEKSVGGSNFDFANEAIETTTNEIIIVGSTESNDFDITQNKGFKDILIIKIK